MQQILDTQTCVIGTRQVMRALEQRTLARAMLAQDADSALKNKLTAALDRAGVPFEWVSSMKHLGKQCGINVGAAVVGILKTA
ncbi:MAG: ribosomal L7Ae/L30e/S12e/Gadd45 family protein [Christensenellales bacterium]|jgi:large subunit ribosomal protein L7A